MSKALIKTPFYGKRKGPVVVVVMDGVGLGPDYAGNAVKAAYKPTLDGLMASSVWTRLNAHGTAVGMPSDADMGNSEVGHNALGAGRVFDQGAKLVQNAIDTGALFNGQGWQEIVANAVAKKSTLHLIGLLSDGNVHSHINHVKALIVDAKKRGVSKVAVHAMIDGRDVGETSALDYTEPFEAWIKTVDANYGIASGGGRMQITMDRYEADWSMVERGWKLHVLAEGRQFPCRALWSLVMANPLPRSLMATRWCSSTSAVIARWRSAKRLLTCLRKASPSSACVRRKSATPA